MRRFLLFFAVIATAFEVSAQCGSCTPDTECVLTPAFPTLCPNTLPDATAGEYYETDISFYLPYEFYEPENGVDVQFNQVVITGTTGLPFGISTEMSEQSGIYIPSVNEHGCARICGTPLNPGNYTININFVASVYVPAFGIEIQQNQSFELALAVLPGSGGNNSFIFDVNTGCDSLFVNFEALLDASPNPTSWIWDFGNGEVSNAKFPPTQFYGDTGTYDVTLETHFLEYVITSVQVNSINGNWCGDVEEPTCDGLFGLLPDLYVVILDANSNLLYQSGSTNNTSTGSWSNLTVSMNNPPYTIQVWDEDEASANDNLGAFSFDISSEGVINFSGAGGTSGSMTVSSQISNSFVNTETISVFPSPNPILEFNDQSNLLSVATDTTLIGFSWFLNGEAIEGQSASEIYIFTPGEYSVQAQNGFGCFGESDIFILCPEAEISYNSNNGIISSDGNFSAYQWYFSGEEIPGANQQFLIVDEFGWYTLSVEADFGCTVFSDSLLVCPTVEITISADGSVMSVPEGFSSYLWVQNGVPMPGANGASIEPSAGNTYWVIVTTDYGCSISSSTAASTVSIEEAGLQASGFSLYPNPARDGFNLRSNHELSGDIELSLANIQGKVVREYGKINATNLSHQWFDVNGVAPGQYLLILSDGQSRTTLRLMVR